MERYNAVIVPLDLLIEAYSLIRSEWEGCGSDSSGGKVYEAIGKILQDNGVDTKSIVIY